MIDNLDLRDDTGLAGYIIIADNKTGKIILKKHNMVVKEGRQYLLDKLFNQEESDLRLRSIFFSNDITATTFLDTYSNLKKDDENSYKEFDFSTYATNEDSAAGSTRPITLEKINNDSTEAFNNLEPYKRPGMKIEIRVKDLTGFNLTSIGSLGLLLTDEETPQKKLLYSRIVFDPILLSNDSDFTITYYTYI